jgi:hypothetical protein
MNRYEAGMACCTRVLVLSISLRFVLPSLAIGIYGELGQLLLRVRDGCKASVAFHCQFGIVSTFVRIDWPYPVIGIDGFD